MSDAFQSLLKTPCKTPVFHTGGWRREEEGEGEREEEGEGEREEIHMYDEELP